MNLRLTKEKRAALLLTLLTTVSLAACNTGSPLFATSHHPNESPNGNEEIAGNRRLPSENPGAAVINKRFLPANRRAVNQSQTTAPVPSPQGVPGWEGTPFGPAPGIAGPAPSMPMMGDNTGMGMDGMGGMPPMYDPMNGGGYNPSGASASPFAYDDMSGQPSPAYPMGTPAAPMDMGSPYPEPYSPAPQSSAPAYPNYPGSPYPPVPTYPAPPQASHNEGMAKKMFGNQEDPYLPPNPVYSDSFVPDTYGQGANGNAGFAPTAPFPTAPIPTESYTPTTPIPLNRDVAPTEHGNESYPWLNNAPSSSSEAEETAAPEAPTTPAPVPTKRSTAMTEENDVPMQVELPGDVLPWLQDDKENTDATDQEGSDSSALETSSPFEVAAATDYPDVLTLPDSPEPFLRNTIEPSASVTMSNEEAGRVQSLQQEIRSLAFPDSLLKGKASQKAQDTTTPQQTGAVFSQKSLA